MFAARAGHADIVSALLARGANPNVGDEDRGDAGLHRTELRAGFRLRRGHPARRRARRSRSARADARRHDAAALRRAPRSRRGGEAAHRGRRGRQCEGSQRHLAAADGHLQRQHGGGASCCWNSGSDVNGQDWYGRSPLWEAVNVRNLYVHNATFKNGIDRAPVLELIKALLAAGADVNARTQRNSAVPPSSAGDHRLAGMGGFHRPDAVPHGRARRRRHRDEAAAGARRQSAHRHLPGHLAADGRRGRELGACADLDRRARSSCWRR